MKKTILFVSDLHVGSRWGLFPRDFQLSTGEVYQLNRGQEYLLECWEHMLGQMPKRFDALIVNGDAINGPNPKESARDQVEQDPEWQVRAALSLLDPVAKRARETYLTQGSTYHVGEAAEHEERLAWMLGAATDPAGHYAWDWLLLDIGGVLLDIAHHQSVVSRFLAMPLEREQQFAHMAADLKGGAADLIVRSHAHRFMYLNVDGDMALSLPSWQLQTRYARRSRWPNRWLSRLIGGVRVDVFPERKTGQSQDKLNSIAIIPLVYPHPVPGEAYHVSQA